MKLEFADGRELEVNDSTTLKKELESLGGSNDFAILGSKDSFIQTSFSDGTYLFQYSEGGSMYESSTADASLEDVKTIFSTYLSGDSSWKNYASWKKMKENSSTSGPSVNFGSSLNFGKTSSGSFTDELLNTAKRSVVNWIKRKIR